MLGYLSAAGKRCYSIVLNSFKSVPLNIWSGVVAPVLLALVLDGGEWSVAPFGCFIAGETAPGTHFIGGWVGPRAGMDSMEKRRIFYPFRESNPDSSFVQPIV
jgi:hypothetical protein